MHTGTCKEHVQDSEAGIHNSTGTFETMHTHFQRHVSNDGSQIPKLNTHIKSSQTFAIQVKTMYNKNCKSSDVSQSLCMNVTLCVTTQA